MNLRHINRGDVKEGGCAMCKPRVSRGSPWNHAYFGGKPIDDYRFELSADGEEAGSKERQSQRYQADPSGLHADSRQHEADNCHHQEHKC